MIAPWLSRMTDQLTADWPWDEARNMYVR